ncbi:MAG: hypothetical protein M1161_00440 [Candidatus Thermoplasmatota archaeon]|jgi:hypothetical protein|nr:hypothetical protein [Candidatus Thermoplasmatota archaeon]
MLYKLLKFVILSRFSKQLLVLMAVLLAWALFISSETGSSVNIYHYYGPAFLAFFLILPILSGGIAVLKSDRDFLFTLPVKRSELALSLFVVQLLSFSLIVIYVLAYSFSNLRPVLAYALVDFIALILTVTSLGPITYSLRLGWRILFASVLAIWMVSALLGFPFSPAAIYSGHPLYAVITSVILAVVTVPLAFRSLSRVDLDLMKTFTRYSSSEVKHVRRFSGMTPMKAMLEENFYTVEVSGRMNSMGGGGSYRSGRFKLSKGVLVTAVVAGVYYYLFAYRLNLSLHNQEIVILILSIYSVIFIMFFTMGVLGNERLWLGFMTRNPTRYLRDLLVAKSLSLSALLSPLAVANFLLAIRGDEQALNFGLFMLIVIPSLLIIVVYMSAFLYPFQIKEEISMPGQFNLRQMGTLLPALPAWFLVALSFGALEGGMQLLALIVTIFTTVSIGGTALALIYSKSLGKRVVDRLVTAGFV